MNRGRDQAGDFFPASRFRAACHRPDIIDLVLQTLDEGAAVDAANAAGKVRIPSVTVAQSLPPVVGILTPQYGASFAKSGPAVSEAASLPLRWAGGASPAGGAQDFSVQPKLYLLAVGVSKYRLGDLSLDYPAKDARDFAAVMGQQKGRLYRDVQVRLLTDGAATRDAVLEGLEGLSGKADYQRTGRITVNMVDLSRFIANHRERSPVGA